MRAQYRRPGTAAQKRRWHKSNFPKCHCARCIDCRKGFPRVGRSAIREQLAEVPDEERVFSDFRELPDDIWDSHGDEVLT